MRQHIFTTALAAAVTALAYGQNLNPTVEVTNTYESGTSSIVKPFQKMAVPDSVTTFNLDFDYSVFDNPYRGAYEFRPYYVQLKPAPKPSTEERLFLRLGAGFTLHPELDLVWTPVRKEKYRMNVYATHRSYFGRYHVIGMMDPVDGVSPLGPTGLKAGGYLADTKVGVDGAFNWDGGIATVDVGYRHRMADDSVHYQKMGGVEARARVRSLPSDEPHFLYDAALSYHYLGSDLSHDYAAPTTSEFGESRFDLDGTFGPVLSAGRRIAVDVDMTLIRYSGDQFGYTGGLSLTPKYEFELDRWRFSLGARIASLIYSDDLTQIEEANRHKSALIYPAVHVDFHLLDDRLVLQAAATGGDYLCSLSETFFTRPFSAKNEFAHSLERIRAMAGVRGNVAGRFRYDLQGGYARWNDALVDGFVIYNGFYQPALYHRGFNLFFGELDYGWKSDHVSVDGKMAYRWTNIAEDAVLSPAAFTGYIRPAYYWGDRFKVGMDTSWSTSRRTSYHGVDMKMPGWVDLGLFAEYRFTHRFGFWVKGGNLLGQAVQRMPVHAEAGMYVTAGILLNF